MKACILSLLAALTVGSQVIAQTSSPSTTLSREALEQLLGPVALYPDALVALILPASTVPSDVVLGARFLESNNDPSLIAGQPWDDSVKALTQYPDVLKWMDENLEWTTSLGEAFTVQPADVMNAIQTLRAEARAAGNLVDTPQQHVVAEEEIIRIIPADPEVIYIPQYDPGVVYVQQYVPAPLVTFSVGFAVGSWLCYDFDWRNRCFYRGNWRGWDHDGWRRGGNNNFVNNNVNVVNINNTNATLWQPGANSRRQLAQRQRGNSGNARFASAPNNPASAQQVDALPRPSRPQISNRRPETPQNLAPQQNDRRRTENALRETRQPPQETQPQQPATPQNPPAAIGQEQGNRSRPERVRPTTPPNVKEPANDERSREQRVAEWRNRQNDRQPPRQNEASALPPEPARPGNSIPTANSPQEQAARLQREARERTARNQQEQTDRQQAFDQQQEQVRRQLDEQRNRRETRQQQNQQVETQRQNMERQQDQQRRATQLQQQQQEQARQIQRQQQEQNNQQRALQQQRDQMRQQLDEQRNRQQQVEQQRRQIQQQQQQQLQQQRSQVPPQPQVPQTDGRERQHRN